jgi:hypothetical protein
MGNENKLRCEQCGGQDFGSFVQYGSYSMKCLLCKADGPATSFMAIEPGLHGVYEAMEVDKDLKLKEKLFKGEITEGLGKIKAEAGKGKLIWLIKLE